MTAQPRQTTLPSAHSRFSDAEEDGPDLFQILHMLWNGKRIILAYLLFTGIAGWTIARIAPPIYEADALIQLEEQNPGLTLPAIMQEAAVNSIALTAEMEILSSRLVLGEVVRTEGLDIQALPEEHSALRSRLARLGLRVLQVPERQIKVAGLTVPDEMIGQPLRLTPTADGYTLTLPNGNVHHGHLGTWLNLADHGLNLRVDRLILPEGESYIVVKRPEREAIDELRARLSIQESARQSSMLRLQLTAETPAEAVRILDAISAAYLNQNVARSSAEIQNSLEFIEEQLPLASEQLVAAQNTLNSYRQAQQSVDLSYETQSLLNAFNVVETKLQESEAQEAQIKGRFMPSHPAYQALLRDRSTLLAERKTLRERIGDLPETQKDIFNLTRELEVAQQVHLKLLNRAQELKVLLASSIGSIRVIDAASTSNLPVAPRRGMIIGVCMMMGLICASGSVLLRLIMRKDLRSPGDLETRGLPVLSTVPHVAEAVRIDQRVKGNLPILAVKNPTSIAVEALRSLRTSLYFALINAPTRSVLLTSPTPNAGKSFTAINLATVVAQAGQKVCLIDADMRLGYLNRYFGLPQKTAGLAEYLAGEADLETVIQNSVEVEGLSFISSGSLPPNPSELLMREGFAQLLETLNGRFDLVLIDSPPALAVTDPVIMARSSGVTLLVARHQQTQLKQINATIRLFETAGCRIGGAILNAHKISGGDSGRDYYRYDYKKRT